MRRGVHVCGQEHNIPQCCWITMEVNMFKLASMHECGLLGYVCVHVFDGGGEKIPPLICAGKPRKLIAQAPKIGESWDEARKVIPGTQMFMITLLVKLRYQILEKYLLL